MWVPTRRLAGLVALGALALVPLGGGPVLAPLAVVWNLLLIVAALADALATPPRDRLHVRRELPASFSLDVPATVTLTVRNDSRQAVRLRLRDTPPPALGEPGDPPALLLPPGTERSTRYEVVPALRGKHAFGGVTARWRSRLGLFERQAHWPLEAVVKVYPNLRALQRYDLLQRAGRLMEAGVRAARLRGAGTEFESLREYQPDDEFRRIHWGATARRGRLVSRRYEVERSQTVLLCLDAGRLMTTQLDRFTRLDHALHAALLLAGIAVQLQDKVGLLVFAEEPLVYLPPLGGRGQLTRLLEALYDVEGRLVEPNYGAAFRLLGLRQRRRALVVLFTDLVDAHASAAVLGYAEALRPAHLPLFVTVRDPALAALADQPPERVSDIYERALAAQQLADRDAALRRLRAHGLGVVDAPPDQVPLDLVNRYLEAKARMLL